MINMNREYSKEKTDKYKTNKLYHIIKRTKYSPWNQSKDSNWSTLTDFIHQINQNIICDKNKAFPN